MLQLPAATVQRLIQVSVADVMRQPESISYVSQRLQRYADRAVARSEQGLPVVAFVGWGRCGKDTAAEIWCKHQEADFTGGCSSAALPLLAMALGVPEQQAWEERHSQRGFWFHWLNEFRRQDSSLLVRMSLAESDCSAGIRAKTELEACVENRAIHHVVWIERPGTPLDPTVEYTREDVLALGGSVLHNSGTIDELAAKITSPSFLDIT